MESSSQQPEPPPITTPSSDVQTSDNPIDYVQLLTHLQSVSQTLYGQTRGVAHLLCQEVAQETQGRVLLLLRHQELSDTAQRSSPILSVSFLVQSRDRIYGTLYVAPDPAEPTHPALPLHVAHLLAQTCGLLLYTFELSACLQGHSQQPDKRVQKSLTKREREVLALICRGYDSQAIARILSITSTTVGKHRQHIYQQLGVHNEHDALLVAYHNNLFSPIEELSD